MIKKNKDLFGGLVHLCLLTTIIILIWTIIEDKVNTFNLFLKTLVIIITGIGGIGLYLPIGFKLLELTKKYGK